MTRDEARAMRRALPEADRRAWSDAIAGHVLAWPVFRRAQSVMCYASVVGEVSTRPLLESILLLGKQLLLPRCFSGGVMEAVPVENLAALVPGRLNILEPPKEAQAVDRAQIDLILAPGLLFDWQGNRLGQGAGYYDRFLAGYRGSTCALAFEAQVVAGLSAKPHDVPLGALATEKGIWIVNRKGYEG